MKRRIVIDERKDGSYQARLEAGFFIWWKTTAKTDVIPTLPACLAELAGFTAKLLRGKRGSAYTRQQRRALGRAIAKTIG